VCVCARLPLPPLCLQGQRFDEPQVVVAEKLTGNEDIPVGGWVDGGGGHMSAFLIASPAST